MLGEVDGCIAVLGIGRNWGEDDGFVLVRRSIEAMTLAVGFECQTEHMNGWLSWLDVCFQGLERFDPDGYLFMTEAFGIIRYWWRSGACRIAE